MLLLAISITCGSLFIIILYSLRQVARQLVEDIKAAGNESFKNEDFYDALWKYEHALQLCRVHSALEGEMATLHCNCSMACLKLGDAGSIDLLDADSIPQMETMWYSFSQQHSCRCLDFKPSVKIAHKVCVCVCVSNLAEWFGTISPTIISPTLPT